MVSHVNLGLGKVGEFTGIRRFLGGGEPSISMRYAIQADEEAQNKVSGAL